MSPRLCLFAIVGATLTAPVGAAPLADPATPLFTLGTPVADPAPPAVLPPDWTGAAPLTGFRTLQSGQLQAAQPTALVLRTPTRLLVQVRVPLPGGRKPLAERRAHDGEVWSDDSVELFCDPRHSQADYYQFVGNAAGATSESHGRDGAWNAAWDYQAREVVGGWEATFAIPFAALGVAAPADGALWGLNVCVNLRGVGNLTWAPLRHGYHEPALFGHLRFSSQVTCGLAAADGLVTGSGAVKVVARGPNLTARWQQERDGRAEPEVKLAIGPSGEATAPVAVPREGRFVANGRYRFTVSVTTADGTPTLRYTAERDVKPPLALRLRAFVTDGILRAEAPVEPAGLDRAKLSVGFELRARDGQIIRREVPVGTESVVGTEFKKAELPAGAVTVKAHLMEGTQIVLSQEKTVDRPLDPPWLGDRTGVTDRVPAPWTPVAIERLADGGTAFGCWGRRYQLGRTPFAERVTALGAEVLAAPIQLRATRGGQVVDWTGGTPTVTGQAAQASWSGKLHSDAATMTATSRVEFDGLIRTDLLLTPGAAAPDGLELEIPIKAEHARYLYNFPGSWGNMRNSRALPADGWRAPFTPFVWLGDDDRGFAWFCESDQHWSPADAKQAVVIERTGDRVTLRLHLWQGKPLDQPVRYTFGFQATPVKQPEKDVWDYRFHHGGHYGLATAPAWSGGGRIDYPAAGRLRADRGTFECWAQLLFDSDPSLPEAEKRKQSNRSLLTIGLPDNSNAGIYWNELHQGPVVWVRERGEVTFYAGASIAAKRGEWHHLAFTWGDAIRCYVDGKLVFTKAHQGLTGLPLDQGTITLGNQNAPFVLDEVRLLDEARAPVAPFGPYTADEHTLLLEHFDQPLRKGLTPAEKGGPGKAAGVVVAPGKFGSGLALGEPTAKPRTQLDLLAEAGVRTMCFHEHWTPWQSHPYPDKKDEAALKSVIDAAHGKRMQFLLYMSRQLADIAPEYELYSEDVLTLPRGFSYTREPKQQDWGVCWRSHWREFCLKHLAETMDRFGNDGWYLDGPEWPCPCNNRHHGCGYQRPDGSIGTTYDIFATREFMRRLYVLTRQRQPTGQLNIHNSTVMVIPTLGWGTSAWNGEQVSGIERGPKFLDVVPLDSFRTELTGRQWGVPSEFLCYEKPWTTHEALSFCLLHDVLVRPNGYGAQLQEMSALWRLSDTFGRKQARFLPYWNNADVVQPEHAAVKVSIHSRGAQGALVIVSNLSDEPRTAAVRLNLAKLGLAKTVQATDALRGGAVALKDGRCEVPLDGFDYAIVWVK